MGRPKKVIAGKDIVQIKENMSIEDSVNLTIQAAKILES